MSASSFRAPLRRHSAMTYTERPPSSPAFAPEATVSLSLRKMITWLVVALIVLYVIQFPTSAAKVVRTAADGLVVAGEAIASFFSSLL